LRRSMAVVDVSCSMLTCVAGTVTAMDVAIALGLLVTEVSEAAKRRMITFSGNPAYFEVPVDTLATKVDAIRGMNWSGTTNLEAVFRLLLHEEIPVERLFIFSDMQFAQASVWNQTLQQRAEAMFREAG